MKLLPLSATLVCLLVACGGDDDAGPAAPDATEAPTADVSVTPRDALPGVWEGTYADADVVIGGDFCLRIALDSSDAITGEVRFGAEDVLPIEGGAVGDSFGFEWGSAIGGATPASVEVPQFFEGGRIEGALETGLLAGTWLSTTRQSGVWSAEPSDAEGCD